MININDIAVRANKAWGDKQIVKAAEELAELSAALMKYWFNRDDESFEHVLEEYADVEIVLFQMDKLLKIGENAAPYYHSKIRRLNEVLDDIENGWRTP